MNRRAFEWRCLLAGCDGVRLWKAVKPVAGGGVPAVVYRCYSSASVDDADVVAAAKFAVAEQSKLGPQLKLVAIESASTQVVAGTNTHLHLKVDDAGTKKLAEAIVYTDLKGVQTVTLGNGTDSSVPVTNVAKRFDPESTRPATLNR